MGKITIHQVVTFAIFFALAVLNYNFYTFRKETIRVGKQSDSLKTELAIQNWNMKFQIDSLKLQNKVIAKNVLFLDSCQIMKTNKTDRAERRGKFVGGLLKGLFPAI
jgi:hypothetical protein